MALPKGLGHAYWSTWSQRGETVSQSLESDETWIGGWDAVGLYEGNNKVPEYQVMSVHLTTHRLILVPYPNAPTLSRSPPSLQVHLRNVRQTEFYMGFMRSSPKITLSLGRPNGGAHGDSSVSPRSSSDGRASREGGGGGGGGGSWTCDVCAFVNPLSETETEPGPSSKCGLCGVGYATWKSMSRPVSRAADKPASPSALAPAPAPVPTPTNGATDAETDKDKRISCPACTFLNHRSLRNCEICSTPLVRKRPMSSTASPAIPQDGGPLVLAGEYDVVRLSFREGGAKEAYRRLKNVLGDKVWERTSSYGRPLTPARGTDSPRPGAGIDGILQTMSLDAKAKDEHMKDAFKDLEVLMVRAGEMVKLAQGLNARLSAAGGAGVNEEDATLIRSSLVQLGLAAPALTQDMVRDEQKYLEGLAKELGGLLTGAASSGNSGVHGGRVDEREGGLMVGLDGRSVIGLDEVWGLWMRARGVALLPPSTLVEILPHLAKSTSPPIHLLTLPSSLQVLHTPTYAPPAILARILARLAPDSAYLEDDDSTNTCTESSISLIEIASYENLPIGLAGELMASIERTDCPLGMREPVGLVRDDQAVGDGGVRWYRDLISGWEL